MHPLLHSAFLQALGYAIINSLWQFALLWLFYFSLNCIFKLSSKQKYSAGLVLELGGFAWFVGTLIFYFQQCTLLVQEQAGEAERLLSPLSIDGVTSLKQQFFLVILRFEQFFPYLSVAYLALLFILLVRWIFAFNYSNSIKTTGIVEIAEKWQEFVRRFSIQLDIHQTVKIFLSEVVQTPLTVGFLKPVILVPIATINYLTTEQLEAVILHELAHIRRYDYLLNLFFALIELTLFYNPFMLLLQQQVKRERENCCDDWVLQYNYNPSSYVKALLQIATNQVSAPSLALKATGSKELLINRVKRIIEKKESSFFNYKYQLFALLLMTVVFSLLSFLSPQKKMIARTKNSKLAKIILEPIAAKIDNPLFNPVFFLADTSLTKVANKKGKVDFKGTKSSVNVSTQEIITDPLVEDEDVAIAEMHGPQAFALTDGANNLKLGAFFSLDQTKDSTTVLKEPDLKRLFWTKRAANEQFIERRTDKEEMRIREIPLPPLPSNTFSRELKNATANLNSRLKKVEVTRLRQLINKRISNIKKDNNSNYDLIDEYANELANLEMLAQQLDNIRDTIGQTDFYTTVTNSQTNFNLQLPAVVFTIASNEKEHPFSYQYSSKPRVKVIRAPLPEDRSNQRKTRREVIIGDDDETPPAMELTPPPPPPAYRKFVRVVRI